MAGSLASPRITGARKRPLWNTNKEKESGAVFGEILRFLLYIEDFFPAVTDGPEYGVHRDLPEGNGAHYGRIRGPERAGSSILALRAVKDLAAG